MIDWRPMKEAKKDGRKELLWDGAPQIASWAYSPLRRSYEWSGGQFGSVINPTHCAHIDIPAEVVTP